jgi:nucleoside permease NupC
MAGAFFRHLSGGSWHTADSKAVNAIFICNPVGLSVFAVLALSAVLRRMLWAPLGVVGVVWIFQNSLDIDMWFAPVAWLMGVGSHGGPSAPALLPGEPCALPEGPAAHIALTTS